MKAMCLPTRHFWVAQIYKEHAYKLLMIYTPTELSNVIQGKLHKHPKEQQPTSVAKPVKSGTKKIPNSNLLNLRKCC